MLIGTTSAFQVLFKSECVLFGQQDSTVTNAYWSWDQADSDKWDYGYRLRDPQVEFYLPKVRPILASGTAWSNPLETRCGRLTYHFRQATDAAFTEYFVPDFFSVEDAPYDGSTSVKLSLYSSDELIVLNEANFEFYWSTVLEVRFEEDVYKDMVTYTYPFDLTFRVTDYCLGWTMSMANITILNPELNTVHYNEVEPKMSISKYILSPVTQFDFSLLTYTQMVELDRVDTGCGALVYTPLYFIEEPQAHLVYTIEDEYEQ